MQPPDGWYPVYDRRGRGGRGRGNTSASSRQFQQLRAGINAEASSSRGNTSNKDPRNDPIYQEFLKEKLKVPIHESSEQSEIIQEEEDNILLYSESINTEIIFLLDYKDLKWKGDPWFLMTRFLSNSGFPAQTYKSRKYYEYLLQSTKTCFFSHTPGKKGSDSYKYSKLVIKSIITMEEWGISPFKEKEFSPEDQKIIFKFNYWDYIEAMNKVFLYENDEKKHSWFIKICAEAYTPPLPNWFVLWWISHGPDIRTLPDIWQDYYIHWLDVSPTMNQMSKEDQTIKETGPMYFFIEFSIPWIFKWIPKVSNNLGIPCIKRHFYTKSWTKMFKIDPISKELVGKDTEDKVLKTLEEYQKIIAQQEDNDSFEAVSKKLQMKQGVLSADEILEAHMNQLKKSLMKNFPGKFTPEELKAFKTRSDTDMASNSSANEDAQDPNYFDEEYDPNL